MTEIVSLETLASHVSPGQSLAVPVDRSGVAMAATAAIIEAGIDNLRLICVPISGLQADLLIGAGAILLPLYLQTVLHQSTFVTGLAVLPGGLVLGLLGRPVGALFDRIGARPLVIPGAIAMAVALWLFAVLGPDSPLIAVIGIHVLLMAGLGLMMTPLFTSGLNDLPENLYSHGSAIMATLQQVMGAFGTTLFVAVATLATVGGGSGPDATGLRAAFIVAGVLGLVGAAGSLFVPKRVTAEA